MTNTKTSTMNPARRAFLSKAVSVAAGSAALTVAATMSGPALAIQRAPDPVFAAIEVHKVATAAIASILDTHNALERELPLEKMHSRITAFEEVISETDDPRWIECERAVVKGWEAETDAACALIGAGPTTLAGVIALLQYANAADVDGETWPRDDLVSDDGTKTRSWHYFLVEMLAEVLPDLVSA